MRILILLLLCNIVAAQSATDQLGALLFERIKAVHPEAEYVDQGGSFEISYKTRMFPIMRPDKRGNWQGVRESKGPDKGGLIVRGHITTDKGYMGAMLVQKNKPNPIENDLYVFTERVIIWPKDDESYLRLEIITPRIQANKELAADVERLARAFYAKFINDPVVIAEPHQGPTLRLHEIELYCQDPDASRDFYKDTIGLPMNFERDQLKVFQLKPFKVDFDLSQHHQDTLRLSFLVKDLEAYMANLKQREITFKGPYSTHLGMREISFVDPDGNMVAVHTATEKSPPFLHQMVPAK